MNDVNARRRRAINGLAEENRQLRAKVAELEVERDRHKQNEQLQMERAIAAEARVAELEAWKADRIKTFEEWRANIDRADNLVQKITESELEAAEAQLAALPKWAQSSESKGQFYRKSVQEMAALRGQLTEMREENQYLKEIYVDMGLHDSACRIDTDGECDCWHERFSAELQSLLTQTAPDVNSEG